MMIPHADTHAHTTTCSHTPLLVHTHIYPSHARDFIIMQELAQEAESKAGGATSLPDDVTWTLQHLEAAMLQSIGRTTAKNPATNENWPPIISLADVLACR